MQINPYYLLNLKKISKLEKKKERKKDHKQIKYIFDPIPGGSGLLKRIPHSKVTI